ncbi:MAG: valine--tRNA ligase [Verrucomicrobia bacterium]|nr:MAG: valine--tRNA ligase [Verrucomicrobiota bacterium]
MPELAKRYDPKSVEPKWYARWLEDQDFKADAKSAKPPFSIVMPPPNITGVLTLGHVLNNTIQDILARRARMQGFEVLWLPGMDHAGIGTQTAVEKWLRKNEGVTRHDLGREKFLQRVLEWQDKHGGIIIDQLKRLGCSCDWSRQRYTFDDAYVRAVEKVFVDLYNKGLIYRGRRMINWDPAAQTALSDEEVINKPQKGNLYFVRYEIPETIMADTGVAVHPSDKRYVDLVGKHAWRPLARQKIPIVADAAIDPEFGTGILKVTPAHDNLDFEIGQRHKLPVIDVLHPDGRINCPAVPELDGLDRFEARKKAAELLQDRHLLAKTEPYENNIGFSDRSDVPIEPRLSEQWFLRYPKTKEALAVVRDHLIRFFPVHWEKVYGQWLENIQDWCISRQVWWGHRIPAWYPKKKSEVTGQKSEIYVGLEPPGHPENWTQEEDTLDTWFSSWLWAYETMDEETRRKFYPTSVLVTAPDIIFFWVARMIVAGLEFKPGKSERDEDNIPFHDVFFTGLIRDKQGRKMSKSLGNSPDPLELIDKYGADGLRFGLMRIAPSGQDIRFDEKQIEEGRNFATKLWNAARLRQMHRSLAPSEIFERDSKNFSVPLTAEDKWILVRLDAAIRAISEALDEYRFSHAANTLYSFFWSEFCDWYLEASKAQIDSTRPQRSATTVAVLDLIFSNALRLMHPFLPFLSEELWHGLGFEEREQKRNPSILFAEWPEPFSEDFKQRFNLIPEAEQFGGFLHEVVEAGRTLRHDSNIASNKRIRFVFRPATTLTEDEVVTLKALLNAEPFELVSRDWKPDKETPAKPTRLGDIFLIVGTLDKQAEQERLDHEIAKVEVELRRVEDKLQNKSFVDRAPAAVVEEHRQRQRDFIERLAKLKAARERLN